MTSGGIYCIVPFSIMPCLTIWLFPIKKTLSPKHSWLQRSASIRDRAFTEIINLDEILYNRKYAYSTTDLIRPQNLLFHNVYGEQNSIRQAVSLAAYMAPVIFRSQLQPFWRDAENDVSAAKQHAFVGLNNLYRNDRNVLLTRVFPLRWITTCWRIPPYYHGGGVDTVDWLTGVR